MTEGRESQYPNKMRCDNANTTIMYHYPTTSVFFYNLSPHLYIVEAAELAGCLIVTYSLNSRFFKTSSR